MIYMNSGDASGKKRRRTWWNASFCLGGSKAREAGLKPAGEDGTYFQFLIKRVANSSTVSVNGKALDLWKRFGQLIWWTLPRRLCSLVGQNAG
jgi:hypothetical protein